MNRAQRRALSKINKSAVDAAEERIMKHQEKVLNDERVEAMFCIFALVLHRDFKFGPKRVYRALQGVDREMDAWVKGYTDFKALKQQVANEIGIAIEI